MQLPENAIVLGHGRSFPVPETGFPGWMCFSEADDWSWDDSCSGQSSSVVYAAEPETIVHHRMGSPEVLQAVARVLPKPEPVESGEIPVADLVNACCPPEWGQRYTGDAQDTPPATNNPADPHGTPQHAPGAKNDAGKMMASLLLGFPRALWAIGEVATYGAKKYSRLGWEHVPNGEERYRDAAMRHLLMGQMEECDQESGMPHEWHYAWGVLSALELKLRDSENADVDTSPPLTRQDDAQR